MKWIGATVVVVSIALTLLSPALARDESSRVVDRTFSCETGYLGGVHQVEAWAHKSVRREGEAKRYGFVTINTNLTNGFLGGVDTRSIWVNRRLCTATSSDIAPTWAGLRGGAVTAAFERRIDCFTPRKVLIRIRGESASATALKAASPFGWPALRAVGNFRKAEIVVGTPTGRHIAYASVDANQRTHLFTAPDCQED